MWNGTAQTDQELLCSSSQRQSNPPHSSKHPPQSIQPVAQDKSAGKLKFACCKYRHHEMPLLSAALVFIIFVCFYDHNSAKT